MDAIVVDIDDTLIDVSHRRNAAWCRVLDREVPMEVTESSGSKEILERYRLSNRGIWERYWLITLCVEEGGADLLQLDKPIPNACEVLQNWARDNKLVYLTGRTENMRQLTLEQLRGFKFPTRGADLEMFSIKDWMQFFSSASSAIATRSKKFSSILQRHNVIRVVDDYPGFFAAYREHSVSEKIGLLRKKRFSPQDYLSKGATRVVENWKQLSQ